MKYRFILVTIFSCLAIHSVRAQDTLHTPRSSADFGRWLRYEFQKKSPTVAAAGSFLLPTLGHAYAGNWKKGLLFGAGRISVAGLTYFAGIEHRTFTDGVTTWQSTRETEWLWVGLGTYLVLTICEAADASHETNKYNEELRAEIGWEEIPGVNYSSKRESVQVQSPALIAAEAMQPDTACKSPDALDSGRAAIYSSEKRSPAVAALLSVIPCVGHVYAGNTGKCWIFVVGRSVGAGLLTLAVFESFAFSFGESFGESQTNEHTSQINALYAAGLGLSVGFLVWEAIDAAVEANRYNDKLFRILTGRNTLGLNILPGRNGTRFQLSCNF